MSITEHAIVLFAYTIIIYFVILSAAYCLLLLCSIPHVTECFQEAEEGVLNLISSKDLPPVTVIICAYNEENYILQTIRSVQRSTYPNIRILVVNADSTDNTLNLLIQTFHLEKVTSIIKKDINTIGELRGLYLAKAHENLLVLDKSIPDKSDCLNMAVNACSTPVFLTLDADSVIETDAVRRIMFYLLKNSHTVALGGAVYISNGNIIKEGQILQRNMSLRPIYAFQSIEYLRAFLFARAGFNLLGGALCYAGTFTLFEKQAIVEIGGFDVGNTAQDFEIITHLQHYRLQHNYPMKVRYLASAAVWTEGPQNVKQLFEQRIRWQSSSLRSIFLHLQMLFNPKYKIIGLFTTPFYFFGELFGPIIEASSYCVVTIAYFLGFVDLHFTLLFILIAFGFNVFLTVATAFLNYLTFNRYRRIGDLSWMIIYSFIENFSYRQFLMVARIVGTFQFFTGQLNREIQRILQSHNTQKNQS